MRFLDTAAQICILKVKEKAGIKTTKSFKKVGAAEHESPAEKRHVTLMIVAHVAHFVVIHTSAEVTTQSPGHKTAQKQVPDGWITFDQPLDHSVGIQYFGHHDAHARVAIQVIPQDDKDIRRDRHIRIHDNEIATARPLQIKIVIFAVAGDRVIFDNLDFRIGAVYKATAPILRTIVNQHNF